MAWKAFRTDGKGKIHGSTGVTKEMLPLAEQVVPEYLSHLEESSVLDFEVIDMVRWIKSKYPEVAPFMSQSKIIDVRLLNPGKSPLDVQDLCYHLSRPKSYWIIDTETRSELVPLIRLGKNHYKLKKSWRRELLLPEIQQSNPIVISHLKQLEVPVLPRSQQEDTVDITTKSQQNGIIDYVKQAADNQALGLAGENFVVALEQDKLMTAGLPHLADKVQHTSVVDGDGVGYDIQSFDESGETIFIEVKTTSNGQERPFFLTCNEFEVSKQLAGQYWLYRVFEFDMETNCGKLFRVSGPVNESFEMTPTLYSVRR